jgi:hypothetical protein
LRKRIESVEKSVDIATKANNLPSVNITCNSGNLTMAKPDKSRKARFRAALALAGLTARQWADREGITAGHLSQVLDGKRESAALCGKVDAFTAKYLTKVAA